MRRRGAFRIVASTGEAIAWDGNLSLNPIASVGSLKAGPFTIPRHGPYLNLATPATVASGTADVALGYSFSWGTSGPDLVVSKRLGPPLGHGGPTPGATSTNLFFQSLAVSDVSAGLAGKYLLVASIRLSDGSFVAQRDPMDRWTSRRSSDLPLWKPRFRHSGINWPVGASRFPMSRANAWSSAGDEQPGTPVRLSALVDQLQILGLSNLTNQPVAVHGNAAGATSDE